MRCKKNEVVISLDVIVTSKDYKGKKIRRGNAEELIEQVLSKVFKAYILNFGKKIAIEFPDVVKVFPDVEKANN